jgi:hypothetical protein
MPQHLWHIHYVPRAVNMRYCEVCMTRQWWYGGDWTPDVNPICPGNADDGDDDDDGGRNPPETSGRKVEPDLEDVG